MGNPYLRVLRSQLEKYIVEELGGDYLMRVKNQTELRTIKKEIADLKKRLNALQTRKATIENSLKKIKTPNQRLPHTMLLRHH